MQTLNVLTSSLLALCVLCVTVVVGLTVTPACLLVFGHYLSFGSCDFNKDETFSEPSLANQNELLEFEIFQLEKQLLSIDCSSERVSAQPQTNQPRNINIREWEEKKISTLKNCWELVGNQLKFQDVITNEISTVHTWSLCFDELGQGNQTLFSNSMTCKSEVSAKFRDDGSLEIVDSTDVQCDDDYVIFRREMTCDLDSTAKAKCKSNQPNSPGVRRGEVIFELVRAPNRE